MVVFSVHAVVMSVLVGVAIITVVVRVLIGMAIITVMVVVLSGMVVLAVVVDVLVNMAIAAVMMGVLIGMAVVGYRHGPAGQRNGTQQRRHYQRARCFCSFVAQSHYLFPSTLQNMSIYFDSP